MAFQNKLSESLKNTGNKIAIKYQQESITCNKVWDHATAIGAFLLDKGLKPGDVVGIYLKNRCDIIYAMIGIATARCVFAPIDTELPEKRLDSLIRDLDPGYIIASKESLTGDSLPGSAATVFFMEDILARKKGDIQWPEYHEDDALYIYFTSGSTGRPKGIVGRNGSLLHFIEWEISAFNIEPGFQFSQFISPYFDAFLRDIFTPLLSGGTICIPPQQEGFLCEENIVPWVNESGITFIHCVPTLFRLINNPTITPGIFQSLKYILMSGEKIIPGELKHWYDVLGARIQLVNLYGATEATLISSYYLIQPADITKGRISIGTPIHDTKLLVANKNLKTCNFLEPGDLYIISDYMSKGYLNAPELTNEKFIKISTEAGDKVAYKTGDKARVFPGGNIDLIGREDRQIKLRGIRIELEEIENALIRSGFIKSAVIVKRTDDKANEMLLAFIIKKETVNNFLSVKGALESYLTEHLPKYMIPADIIELENFPLLSNGKINYARLQDHTITGVKIKPANEVETKLMAIWQEILGDKELSTEDVFYKSGGNSISIMRLISLIYRDFSVRVSLSELFNNPTIKKQAELIRISVKNNLMRIQKTAIKPAYQVSAVQERLYYNYELNKKSLAYNLPMIWEIDRHADDEKIAAIIRQLIARHESFRTGFKLEDGRILQVVHESVDFNMEKVDIGDTDFSNAIVKAIRPFDLGQPPLLRGTILQNAAHKKILVIDIHHIVCDGMSQWILNDDFVRLYQEKELTPLLIQPKDYAEWEARYRAGIEYTAHREFWLKSFEGKIPEFKLPTSYSGKSDFAEMGGEISFFINKSVVEAISGQLTEKEITTFSILLSLYFIYLVQLTGEEDLVIGIATTGRLQHELDDVVGMFVKTLPIRYKIEPDSQYADFVTGLHKYLVQAYNNQLYDLSDIVETLNIKNGADRNLFNTMFVFHNFADARHDANTDKFKPYKFNNTAPKYPISLRVVEEENAFNFRLEYSTAYFTKGDIEILVNQFEQLAQLISENPDATIVSCISKFERPAVVNKDDIIFNF